MGSGRGKAFSILRTSRPFLAICPWLQRPVEFLYLSGWRVGEMRSLRWADVNMDERVAVLKIENSKTKRSRPLTLEGRLWDIVREAHGARRLDCPFVFHWNGQPIGNFRKRWNSACRAAGIEGVVVHDLCRSATRNLREAGVQGRDGLHRTCHQGDVRPVQHHGRRTDEAGPDPVRRVSEATDRRAEGQSHPVGDADKRRTKYGHFGAERDLRVRKLLKLWWSQQDSNLRPLACEASALAD